MGSFDRVISPRTHFMPCSAERMTLLVESDILRIVFGGCRPAVDIDQLVHITVLKQFISRNVVMGGIETDIFRGKAKTIPSEIVNCVEEIFAAMAFGIRKLHERGEIRFQGIVSSTEHIQSMSEIPCFLSLSHPHPASGSGK